MKVGELRAKLNKMTKQELQNLAVEFYKLIPKAKKEDYDIDGMVNHPSKRAQRSKKKKNLSLIEMETEISEFILNVKAQYYLYPNRVVPKKKRSTWRFSVKAWYKELNNQKREDLDLVKQAELQHQVYELLCEACGSEYFTAYDPFQSVGVDQIAYFRSVIELIIASAGKVKMVERGISLIVNNYLNRYTLDSDLMEELIIYLDIPDLKYRAIAEAKKMIISNNYVPPKVPPKPKRVVWISSVNENYQKRRIHNALIELVLRLHFRLFEYEEGIGYYHKNHYESSEEVKLYILIRRLFEYQLKDQIVIELENAIERGIKPRENLMSLLRQIKENDQLPQYM